VAGDEPHSIRKRGGVKIDQAAKPGVDVEVASVGLEQIQQPDSRSAMFRESGG